MKGVVKAAQESDESAKLPIKKKKKKKFTEKTEACSTQPETVPDGADVVSNNT